MYVPKRDKHGLSLFFFFYWSQTLKHFSSHQRGNQLRGGVVGQCGFNRMSVRGFVALLALCALAHSTLAPFFQESLSERPAAKREMKRWQAMGHMGDFGFRGPRGTFSF